MAAGASRASALGFAALAVAAALGGCAGDGAGELLGSGGPVAAAGGARQGAERPDPSAYGAAAQPAAAAFNPFSPDASTDRPEREVLANPSLEEVLKSGPLPEFSLGRPDAPVVMVKYMSLTCPHCRRFMAETFPALKREYIDTGKVRLVIREFPIGKTSGNATIALRCAPMSEYLTLYRKFLEQQPTWVSQEVRPEAILKVASQVGVTPSQYDACVKDQSMIAGLNAVKERGRQLGIIGTPNFFIGNRLVKSVVGMAEIRVMVDAALGGRG